MSWIEDAILCFEGSQAELARAVGVTPQLVTMWINGKRKPSIHKTMVIEKVTLGLVTKERIRDDVSWNL